MTVYLAFNEYEGLADVSDIATSSLAVPSSRNRTGFALDNPTSAAITRDTITFTGLSEGWVHLNFYLDHSTDSASALGKFFSIIDADDNEVVSFSRSGTGYADIYVTSALAGSTYIGTRFETISTFDINVGLDTTSGFIKIFLDNSLVYDLTGDTIQSTGGTTFDKLRFRSACVASGVRSDGRTVYSEVLVSDSNTLGAKVYTLTPEPGSINDWVSGTESDVDEAGVDDSNYIFTDTDGDQFAVDSSVTLSGVTSPTQYTALIQSYRASYDSGASVTQITPFLNDTTATNINYGTTTALTNGFVNYQEIWSTDPADSSDWTATKINNYEFGVRADT